jgi:DNA polymerase
MTDDIAMPRQRLAFMDLETWSGVPIRHGAWAYAEGAEVLLWAYALNDGPVAVWDLTGGDPMPAALAAILVDDAITTVWHNGSMFDTTVLKVAMGIDIPLARLHDTMVQALQHSLPGSLGALCEVLGVPSDKAKDKAGKELIRLFCVPLPFRFPKARKDFETKDEYDAAKLAASENWPGRATSKTHPADWARFKEYAASDVIAMRGVYKRMPQWNCKLPYEREIFHVDQRINRRGMYIDLALARGALAAVDEEQELLRERTYEMTNGQVQSASKRDQLLLHILETYGVDLPDMQKSTLERRIADPDLPEGLKELLRVRLSTATTSTSKYQALLNCVSSDGRLRGTKQYCGASRTGRWAGRLFQPDNLPSRGLMSEDQIELGIQALKDGTAGLLFDDVMWLTSSAIRGCIAAPPGKKLVVADLSNIEGRGIAYLAGEQWKLDAFRAFDEGRGEDLYKLAYAKSFGIAAADVTKDQRQIGKVQELALAYQGGVGAFVTFAAGYGLDLEELAEKAQRYIPGEVWGQSSIMLEWHRSKGRDPAAQYGLSDRAWLVCESFVLGWRAGHGNIKAWWHDLEDKIRQAITTPDKTYLSGKLKIRRDGAWLRVVLPSGRALCYPGPALQAERKKKDEIETADIETVRAVESDSTEGRTSITYLGMNQYSRKWSRIYTYGGKNAENDTQGFARDVMAWNMPIIDGGYFDGDEFIDGLRALELHGERDDRPEHLQGYGIVLTVHDEAVTEAPDDPRYNPEHLAALLCAPPPWAPDMPLAAAGFESYRYKK